MRGSITDTDCVCVCDCKLRCAMFYKTPCWSTADKTVASGNQRKAFFFTKEWGNRKKREIISAKYCSKDARTLSTRFSLPVYIYIPYLVYIFQALIMRGLVFTVCLYTMLTWEHLSICALKQLFVAEEIYIVCCHSILCSKYSEKKNMGNADKFSARLNSPKCDQMNKQ